MLSLLNTALRFTETTRIGVDYKKEICENPRVSAKRSAAVKRNRRAQSTVEFARTR